MSSGATGIENERLYKIAGLLILHLDSPVMN